MTNTSDKFLNRTKDGFIHYGNNRIETGLKTKSAVPSSSSSSSIQDTIFDVIIIGAGFTGLTAARELCLRNRNVLIIEASDRIGGRTFTAEVENDKYEIGGTWVHWSQPHVWTEITRYGFSISESKGVAADQMTVLLDNGSQLKQLPMTTIMSELCEAMNKYSDIDGVQGRTVLPYPHDSMAAPKLIETYDKITMQDRLDQISSLFENNKELYEVFYAYISMNSQEKLSESGFIDHLRWWILGDYEACRLFDKTSRYKLNEGTSALAKAIFNDCRNVKLLLSTPVVSINRTNDNNNRNVIISTQNGQLFTARTAIITIPLNTLSHIKFLPPLKFEKQRAINEGQCRGGGKFSIKLKKPIGSWIGYASYPSPITVAYTDDEEGTNIIVFILEDLLDMKDFDAVEREMKKFLPDIQIKYIIGHDWRNDTYIGGTWGWYRPGKVATNLLSLQENEPPVFFASSDIADGWRHFMDGAIESGLTVARHIECYISEQSILNK